MLQTNLFTKQKETDTLKAHLQSPTGSGAGRGGLEAGVTHTYYDK